MERGTCYNILANDENFLEDSKYIFICSNCGCRALLKDDEGNGVVWLGRCEYLDTLSYCPNCGNEVLNV